MGFLCVPVVVRLAFSTHSLRSHREVHILAVSASFSVSGSGSVVRSRAAYSVIVTVLCLFLGVPSVKVSFEFPTSQVIKLY